MDKTKQQLEAARQAFAQIDVSEELRSQALDNLAQWLHAPECAESRPQLDFLFETENFNVLFDSFFRQIPFGTGGRRGPVGFGTNRINTHTIATSIQGHCEFLRQHRAEESSLTVVIAYDVRVFRDLRRVYDPRRDNPLIGVSSHDFARVAAQVYAANGIQVWFPPPKLSRHVSTPELSFTIRQLKAVGGLNVSASHNHPDDNGAKVYNETGGQEIPPLDEVMAKIVEGVTKANTKPWDTAVAEGLIRWIPAEVYSRYIETNRALTLNPKARGAKVVFTPLHGTGWSSLGTTLKDSGFDVVCLEKQEKPDGLFPNVPFRSPNPEVPESLDAAIAFAGDCGADLVLATDPDADRLGMAAPDTNGKWVFLTGNDIGVLLAAYMLAHDGPRKRKRPFAVTTVVTTSLFTRLAEANGVRVVNDLGIGFKYIAHVLRKIEEEQRYLDVEASIADYVLGIEESHGYLVTPDIRDKDAAGAGLLLAELASELKKESRSLLDYLNAIYCKYGYVRNHLRSNVMLGARGFLNIQKIQKSLREDPPKTVGGLQVLKFTDRWDEDGPLGPIVSDTDRAARDLLIFELERNARVILRPSGTESKNKVYVEVCGEPLGDGTPANELRRSKQGIDALAVRLAEDFCLEAFARIGVALPRYALQISDLVPLECKQDFAETLLPELIQRIESGEQGAEVEKWLDGRLAGYGADGRLLVRRAVQSYCATEKPTTTVEAALRELFGLSEVH